MPPVGTQCFLGLTKCTVDLNEVIIDIVLYSTLYSSVIVKSKQNPRQLQIGKFSQQSHDFIQMAAFVKRFYYEQRQTHWH